MAGQQPGGPAGRKPVARMPREACQSRPARLLVVEKPLELPTMNGPRQVTTRIGRQHDVGDDDPDAIPVEVHGHRILPRHGASVQRHAEQRIKRNQQILIDGPAGNRLGKPGQRTCPRRQDPVRFPRDWGMIGRGRVRPAPIGNLAGRRSALGNQRPKFTKRAGARKEPSHADNGHRERSRGHWGAFDRIRHGWPPMCDAG